MKLFIMVAGYDINESALLSCLPANPAGRSGRFSACPILPAGKATPVYHGDVTMKLTTPKVSLTWGTLQTTRKHCSGTKITGKNDRLVKVEGFPVIIDGQLVCSVAEIQEISSVQSHIAAQNEANLRFRDTALQKEQHTFADIIHKS